MSKKYIMSKTDRVAVLLAGVFFLWNFSNDHQEFLDNQNHNREIEAKQKDLSLTADQVAALESQKIPNFGPVFLLTLSAAGIFAAFNILGRDSERKKNMSPDDIKILNGLANNQR